MPPTSSSSSFAPPAYNPGGRGGPIADTKGNPTSDVQRYFLEINQRVFSALTPNGQINSRTQVAGRTEGLGTTLQHLDPLGRMGSAGLLAGVGFNYSNNCIVDSVDNGSSATVRVYGAAGGAGTVWNQKVGSVLSPNFPALAALFTAYNSDIWVYYDGNLFHLTSVPGDTLGDGLVFCGKLHTVAAAGGGGVSGGGGINFGSGGRNQW